MRLTTLFTSFFLVTSAACGDSQSGADADPIVPDSAPVDANEVVDSRRPGDAAEGAIRILPLGDSLTLGYGSGTEGSGSEGGYRSHLAELLLADAVNFDFVGSQKNGPTSLDDHDHEGHNGFAVSQVGELTNAALDTYQPDVILLMVGTNDQIVEYPPSQPPADAADDLEALLEQIDDHLDGVQIIVAQVIPLTLADANIVEYNGYIPGIVADLSGQGINVRMVDMYAIGTENLSSDGIHPTAVGYNLIADIWYPALTAAISELPTR